MVFSDVGMVAEALGSKYEFPENDVPVLVEPMLKDVSEADRLVLPVGVTPGRWGVYYKAIETLYNAVGDRVTIMAFVPAPFTTAAGLCGTEEFLVDLLIDPENAHVVLESATKAVIELLSSVTEAGALPVLVDPLASGSVLSADQFSTFALPYIQEVIRFLHRYDMDVLLHICGKTTQLLESISETKADLFSLDDTPLETVCACLGDQMRIVGNIRPSDLLLWTPERVVEETNKVVNTAKQSPKGFALSTGCEVPLKTPRVNVEALIRTGLESGRYW